MNKLYAYRGWILGALGLAVIAMPPSPFPQIKISRLLEHPELFFSDEVFFAILVPAAVFLVSVILRVQARRSIGEHTRGYSHDADRLVTEGLYARIRHPLYVSNTGVAYSLILLHLGLTPVAVIPVVALLVFEIFLSKMEDRYLENRFGDEWRKWAAKTPAFFPRLSQNTETQESSSSEFTPRSFEESFRADASTWFWLLFCIFIIVLRKLV